MVFEWFLWLSHHYLFFRQFDLTSETVVAEATMRFIYATPFIHRSFPDSLCFGNLVFNILYYYICFIIFHHKFTTKQQR